MNQTTKGDESAAFERRRLRWLKTRQRGMLEFVLTRGVLGFGGLCFTIAIAAQIAADHSTRNLSPGRLVLMVVIWCVAGVFWGVWLWRWLDERSREVIDNELPTSPKRSK
jgi:hypothetical protein